MYRIKNLLETTSGKIIATICVGFIIVLIWIVGILIFSSGGEDEEILSEQETTELEFDDSIASEILYSGVWYSNRPDEAILTLREDETYSSTAWLFQGQFFIEGNEMILEELGRGTFLLELHTIRGETVLYDPSEGYYFYSSREQLEEAIKTQQNFSELEADVEQQKWLDVLKQGTWTYEVDEIQYSMTFSDNYIEVQNTFEEEVNKAIFYYYLEGIHISDEHLVDITFRRRRKDVETTYLSASFQIEETSTKYILTAQAGTFIWNNTFEKPINEVELTQNGVTEAERRQLQSISIDEDENRVIVRERVLD